MVGLQPGAVLVLGGTGFRGHLTTEQLVRDGHNVTVISRGFRYWDNFQRLAPHIAHWRCNRTLARDYGGAVVKQSSHAVYDVSKNKTHLEPHWLESDAVRPGREISPMDRWALKEKSVRGDTDLECEED
eukprot:Skav212981  [mRNA]  locus=scaffold423:91699:93977:- [translate_table: standard]